MRASRLHGVEGPVDMGEQQLLPAGGDGFQRAGLEVGCLATG
jgi:hypothetical protein